MLKIQTAIYIVTATTINLKHPTDLLKNGTITVPFDDIAKAELYYGNQKNIFKNLLGETPNCGHTLPTGDLRTSYHSDEWYIEIKLEKKELTINRSLS